MDPQRLYQLLLVMGIIDIPLHDLFQYELCSYLPSLFDTWMKMRTGDRQKSNIISWNLFRQALSHQLMLWACSFLLMEEAYCINFLGLRIQAMHRYATCMCSMSKAALNMWWLWLMDTMATGLKVEHMVAEQGITLVLQYFYLQKWIDNEHKSFSCRC